MSSHASTPRPLILLAVLASGAAGLTYEMVWTRYLALLLGHTSHAIAVVLAVFMGGLAAGNYLAGTMSCRLKNPLKAFACAELSLACYALAFPLLFPIVQSGFLAIAGNLAPGGILFTVCRLAAAIGLVGFPSILMGTTIPLMAECTADTRNELRNRVAVLYFANSLGAVAGCGFADFWWIPAMGLTPANLFGATLSGFSGLLALRLSAFTSKEASNSASNHTPWRTQETSNLDLNPAPNSIPLGATLAFASISGMCGMVCEILWTRQFALVMGSSTNVFAIVLMAFIGGISMGSWTCSLPWVDRRPPERVLGLVALAFAGWLGLALIFSEWLPLFFTQLVSVVPRSTTYFPLFCLMQAFMAVVVIGPAALLQGIIPPIAARLAAQANRKGGNATGLVFSANTIGAVSGAVIGGFLLLPRLGLVGCFGFCAGTSLLTGVLAMRPQLLGFKLLLPIAACAILAIGSLSSEMVFGERWRSASTLSLWRFPQPPGFASYGELKSGNKLISYVDGAGATVSVNRFNDAGNDHLNLKINGKSDASTAEDVSTQLLLGHAPLLLKPDSRDALIIGLGSGMTAAAVAAHPSVTNINVLEISPEVVNAARIFEPYNRRVLENPRVHVLVEDAKSHLSTSPQMYDAIISEPSNPWVAGVAGVFTREFFFQCKSRLNPGGIMVQWIHVYECSDLALDIIFKTFGSVFGSFGVWQSSAMDLLLISGTPNGAVNWKAIEDRFEVPAVRADLHSIHLHSVPAFLACQAISDENSPHIPSLSTPLHSDLHPILERECQKAVFTRTSARAWRVFDERLQPRPSTLLGNYLRSGRISPAVVRSIAMSSSRNGFPPGQFARSSLLRWQKESPGTSEASSWLPFFQTGQPSYLVETERLSSALGNVDLASPTNHSELSSLIQSAVQAYRRDRSALYIPDTTILRKVLEKSADSQPEHRSARLLQLAELEWDRGDEKRFAAVAAAALHEDVETAIEKAELMDAGLGPRILAIWIEMLRNKSRPGEVKALVETAGRLGYTQNQPRRKDPRLEMVLRKATKPE